MASFEKVPPKPDFPQLEEQVLDFWRSKDIEAKIQDLHRNDPKFVFLEGPPTANGMPHVGHALTRAVKDVFLRYKTMTGHSITPRVGGWDCHGLPVELEVEKELGISSKQGIEEFGIEEFNDVCRTSVFRYVKEWETLSERIGLHLDLPNSYVTLRDPYIEKVWGFLKEAYDRGLLFKGHRILPLCTRCETTLSSHEVAQGYKEIEDISLFVKFQSKEDTNTYFLAWTTTPWTLCSNLILAIKGDAEYVKVQFEGENLIMAKAAAVRTLKTEDLDILETFKGADLVGKEYEPLFEFTRDVVPVKTHYVAAANFVGLEEGTGIVHIAPGFGLEDQELCDELGIPVFNPVNIDGTFSNQVPDYAGMHVLQADREILNDLSMTGQLLYKATVKHTYPHCWRDDSKLIYYATDSWLIGMSKLRKELVEANAKIRWKPAHLRDGRFGNFLDEAKDWAVSRARYWGTPIPIWRCKDGHEVCVGSKKELEEFAGELPEKFELHRPFVDNIKFPCPECSKEMVREPYVCDAWLDSGMAWHASYDTEEAYQANFPVDFITEAIDQTRGWFYTLHATSVLWHNQPSFLSCLCMGHILNEAGEKMSKSRGTAMDPMEVMSDYGADTLRWVFFTSPVWTNTRLGDQMLQEATSQFLLPLWNTYSFFVTYARLDEFNAQSAIPPVSERPALDQWLLSRLNRMITTVRESMENLVAHRATRAIQDFLTHDVSNWWIRRSRRRFWEKIESGEKIAGYATLYEALVTLTKILAPFTPFLAEVLYENLVGNQKSTAAESVHLETLPESDKSLINSELEEEIGLLREIVASGRTARSNVNIRIRQPLQRVTLAGPVELFSKLKSYENEIKEELNVKSVEYASDLDIFQERRIQPNYGVVGPKFKQDSQHVANALKGMTSDEISELLQEIESSGKAARDVEGIANSITLTQEDFRVEVIPKEDIILESLNSGKGHVVLDSTLTPELLDEGLVRDLVRRIQSMRKDMELEYDAEISIGLDGDEHVKKAVQQYQDFIQHETIAKGIEFELLSAPGLTKEWSIKSAEGRTYSITITI
ncbi:MAG: isoleucine--tRNA ligase, partial [Candidatus Hodarchaeales archaeon]